MLVPDVGGRNRKLARYGVGIVLGCLLCRLPVLALSPLAILAVELILLVGIWFFTLRCHADGRVTRTLAWALRLVAIVESMFTIVRVLEISPWQQALSLYDLLTFVVLPVAGTLFVAARLYSFGLPKVARRMLWVLASCIVGCSMLLSVPKPFEPLASYALLGFPLYLFTSIWVFVVMFRLRRTLKVEHQQWWLDVEARPRVEWTSYALLGDGRVELVRPDGKVSWYDSYNDANAWLTQRGFCRGDQVMREQLIHQGAVPPLLQTQVKTG